MERVEHAADRSVARPHDRGTIHERRERLSKLVPKIGPVSFARDRVLPVAPALQPLFPDGGLPRGSVIGCQGHTALAVALATMAGPSQAGSWVALVGVPSVGLRAASELGMALDRLVMVADRARDIGEEPWGNVVSALIDGFDLVVLRADVRPTIARRLQARLQNRGTVLLVVGDPGPFTCDLTIRCGAGEWEGLGHGSGRLTRRRLTIAAGGRRLPRERSVDVWLPGPSGGLEPAPPVEVRNPGRADRDDIAMAG